MELSFNELKKREVININDGKSMGYITDLTLSFPAGTLTGITVPERKMNFICRLFNKSEVFIGIDNIMKIGNDVILVNLKCGDVCAENVGVGKKPQKRRNGPPCSPCNPCRPDSNCPPDCERLFGNVIDEDDE